MRTPQLFTIYLLYRPFYPNRFHVPDFIVLLSRYNDIQEYGDGTFRNVISMKLESRHRDVFNF